MSTELKHRRGTTAQHTTFTGAAGEITVDTNKGTAVVHDGVTAGGSPLAKESALVPNLVHNPGMASWQSATTLPAMAHRQPMADGFLFGGSGTAVFAGSRVTGPSGSKAPYALQVACTTSGTPAADTERHIRYVIYGHKLAPYASQDLTLRFKVYSSMTGTHCVAILNELRDRTYILEYTVNVANTWEEKTLTIPFASRTGTWNLGGGYGLGVRFALAAGSNFQTAANAWQVGNFVSSPAQVNLGSSTSNVFRVSEFGVYPGTTPPSFSMPDYEDTFSESLRQIRVLTSDTGGSNIAMGLPAPDGGSVNFDMPLGAPMYAAPTTSIVGTLNTDVVITNHLGAPLADITNFISYARSRDMMKISFFKAGAFTTGQIYFLRLATATGRIVVDGHLP